jgi:hypothetical protein
MRPGPAVSLLALGLSYPIVAAAQSSENQFWPELDVYINVNQKSRVFLEYSATRTKQLQDYSEGLAGAYFDYFLADIRRSGRVEPRNPARTKHFMFRGGYSYSRTPASGKSSAKNESTPLLLVDANVDLPGGVLITDRNRGDFQIVNGVFEPIYRNRLRFDRDTQVGRIKLDPYAYIEAFYEAQYGKFNRLRYTGGMEVGLNRYVVLEAYYTRQNTTTSSIKYVNALGLILQLHFR